MSKPHYCTLSQKQRNARNGSAHSNAFPRMGNRHDASCRIYGRRQSPTTACEPEPQQAQPTESEPHQATSPPNRSPRKQAAEFQAPSPPNPSPSKRNQQSATKQLRRGAGTSSATCAWRRDGAPSCCAIFSQRLERRTTAPSPPVSARSRQPLPKHLTPAAENGPLLYLSAGR